MTNFTGQSFGRYHLLEQLGEGGMATVYKAYDTRLERDVAVKIIRVDQFAPAVLERILKRFEREAKALGRLTHPNIVPVIDYGEYDGTPYLVMPYLPGGTLKQILGKPLPWQEAVHILLPVARALQFAHSQNIIHRDIKPSNILVSLSGEPMLGDFGIAKIIESDDVATLTGTGTGVGTPEYMAPEQWTGGTVVQSDIYSLGVVLYELVTGRKPYIADTPVAILLKQASEPLPLPRQFVPDLPEAVEKLLLKALAKKPEDRYADMGALAAAMDALFIGQNQQPQSIISPAQPSTRMNDSMPTVEHVVPKAETPPSARMDDSLPTMEQVVPGTEIPPSPSIPGKKATPPAPPPARKTRWWPWAVGLIGLLAIAGIFFAIIKSPKAASTPTSTPVISINTTSPYRVTAIQTALPPSPPALLPTPIPGEVVVPITSMKNTIPWLDFTLNPQEIPVTQLYGFNTTKPPFDNILVRQAFASAVDRESVAALVAKLYAKNVLPATTFLPPQLLGRYLYNEVGIPYNPGQAKDLLVKAGYGDANSFPHTTLFISALGSNASDAYQLTAEAIVKMWKDILGIDVTIKNLGTLQSLGDYLKMNPQGFEIYRMGIAYTTAIDMDPTAIEVFSSDGNLNQDSNYGHFNNSEFEKLLQLARNEPDPAKRQILYIEAERVLCEEQAAIIPLYYNTTP